MSDSRSPQGSARLRKKDVPTLEDGNANRWEQFTSFALALNWYEVFGDELGTLANRELERFERGEPLAGDVDLLRTCLFFEQRRWRHFGVEPDGPTWSYISRTLDTLRELLPE